MDAILAGALGGAAGGVLGALVGWAIEKGGGTRKKDLAKKIGSFAAIVCAVVGGRLGPILVKPSIESQLDQVAVFATIHKYYPIEYAEMVASFKASQANGDSKIVTQNKIRPLFSALIGKHIKEISDENATALMALTIEEAKIYRAKDPLTCVTMLNGGTSRSDITTIIPPEVEQRDLDTSSKILVQIATAPAKPPSPISEAEISKLAISSLQALPPDEQKVAASVLAAKRAASNQQEASAFCDFSISFLQNAIAAKGGILRSLMASS